MRYNGILPVATIRAQTLWVHPRGKHSLGGICAGLVVQHGIKQDLNAGVPRGADELVQVGPGAPLGRPGALLVKLAQVIQIVDVVAVAPGTTAALAGRWDPKLGDAQRSKAGYEIDESTPVTLVGGEVPLKALKEGLVTRRRSGGWVHVTGAAVGVC